MNESLERNGRGLKGKFGKEGWQGRLEGNGSLKGKIKIGREGWKGSSEWKVRTVGRKGRLERNVGSGAWN